MKKILVTGATGQLGAELTQALRDRYGSENVVSVGYDNHQANQPAGSDANYHLDVRDAAALNELVESYRFRTIDLAPFSRTLH